MNTLSTQSDNTDQDIEKNKVLAAIGYIWILFLIPLLGKKNSRFAQFHGRQGLALFIIWIVVVIVGWIPILGWLVAFLGSIATVIFSIIGVIKSLRGEYWELPVLGEYAKKINL